MTRRSKPASRITGKHIVGQVALAEVEGSEGLDPVAVGLVQGLGDARPLPLEDGVVRVR